MGEGGGVKPVGAKSQVYPKKKLDGSPKLGITIALQWWLKPIRRCAGSISIKVVRAEVIERYGGMLCGIYGRPMETYHQILPAKYGNSS